MEIEADEQATMVVDLPAIHDFHEAPGRLFAVLGDVLLVAGGHAAQGALGHQRPAAARILLDPAARVVVGAGVTEEISASLPLRARGRASCSRGRAG